jgi:hypothetical protein
MTPIRIILTRGARTKQECVLVHAFDRVAVIPLAPPTSAIASIAGALVMVAAGVYRIRLGEAMVELDTLATARELDAVVTGTGGFYLDEQWRYRANIPVIGTMIMRGDANITTREPVPAAILARLTRDRSALRFRPAYIVIAVGAAVIAAGVIAFVATGRLDLLFGIGTWGVLIAGAALYALVRMRRLNDSREK